MELKVKVGEPIFIFLNWVLYMSSRFLDNGNGTVTDNELKLIWRKTDSFQDTKKWMNWFKGQDYIEIANIERLGGYENWRYPNQEEACSLFGARHGRDEQGDWGRSLRESSTGPQRLAVGGSFNFSSEVTKRCVGHGKAQHARVAGRLEMEGCFPESASALLLPFPAGWPLLP